MVLADSGVVPYAYDQKHIDFPRCWRTHTLIECVGHRFWMNTSVPGLGDSLIRKERIAADTLFGHSFRAQEVLKGSYVTVHGVWATSNHRFGNQNNFLGNRVPEVLSQECNIKIWASIRIKRKRSVELSGNPYPRSLCGDEGLAIYRIRFTHGAPLQ